MKLIPGFHGGTIFNPVLAGNGTAAAPTYSFASDPDTGMYRVGANTLGFATTGALQMQIAALANVVDFWSFAGGIAGAPGVITANALGADTDITMRNIPKGAGEFQVTIGNINVFRCVDAGTVVFGGGVGAGESMRVTSAASQNTYARITGANSANPVLTTSGFNLQLMTGAALATSATAGMILIPATAGTPSGAVTGAGAGAIPMIYDTSANKIWFYNGSWRGVAVA